VAILYGVSTLVGGAVLASHSALPTLGKLYLSAAVVATVLGGLVIVTRLSRPESPSGEAKAQQSETS
jgi:hypothetical protein